MPSINKPPTSRVIPFSVADCPTVIFLRYLSLVSRTRCHVIVDVSKSRRANLLISSSVRSSGFVLSMPRRYRNRKRPRVHTANVTTADRHVTLNGCEHAGWLQQSPSTCNTDQTWAGGTAHHNNVNAVYRAIARHLRTKAG